MEAGEQESCAAMHHGICTVLTILVANRMEEQWDNLGDSGVQGELR